MTTHLHPAQAGVSPPPGGPGEDPHRWLHSQAGSRPGEHPGRSGNPLVKVAGLAWLEFEKPDLDRAGRFGADFGFTVADQTPETLVLRGRQAAAGLVRLDLAAATTGGLLADRAVLQEAIDAAQATAANAPQDAVPAESADLLSPVTAPARVVAQAVNYRAARSVRMNRFISERSVVPAIRRSC